MKLNRKCPHCGKLPGQKEDTGYTTKLLEGSIHGYVAWQETIDETGKETFYCVPHGIDRDWTGLYQKQFSTMEELGKYIGNNKLKTY
jgi:hypothetical protein|tara:strand:- start:292 stop:552 length:261 start_codon:yes stop_codon:yes gene_type:complete